MKGAGHGLKSEGAIAQVHRGEGDDDGAVVCSPLGGRLDCIQDM